MDPGSSHEKTSQGQQDLKVQVAARVRVLMMAVGPQRRKVGVRGYPGGCRRASVFPVLLSMDLSAAFVCVTYTQVCQAFQNLTQIYVFVQKTGSARKRRTDEARCCRCTVENRCVPFFHWITPTGV